MATMAMEKPLRAAAMLAKPVYVDPAFDEPERVLALARKSAPYRLSNAVHGKADLGRDVPFFRAIWARHEELHEPDAAFVFHNERFIEAAKESFDATIVIPTALMNNVACPMPGGNPHLDLPRFRGGERFPFEMLVAMNYSGLFHEWAVPIASTVSWFYDGIGGNFDYWPDGPAGSRQTVSAPLWNVGVVSDNEYMFHRVGGFGDPREQLNPGDVRREAMLEAEGDGSWTLVEGDRRRPYREEQIRISILWKAYAFADKAALATFRDERHHLPFAQAMRMLDADLDRRGLGRLDLETGFEDPRNAALIRENYTAPQLNDVD